MRDMSTRIPSQEGLGVGNKKLRSNFGFKIL
jgi:hypothetical protein